MVGALGAKPARHDGGRPRSWKLEYEHYWRVNVAIGIVKWFNPVKGYGFIRPKDGSADVFVHISAVQKAGYTTLAEGSRVDYELVPARSGKMSAENLRVG